VRRSSCLTSRSHAARRCQASGLMSYPVGAVPMARLTGQRLTAHSGRKDHRAGEGNACGSRGWCPLLGCGLQVGLGQAGLPSAGTVSCDGRRGSGPWPTGARTGALPTGGAIADAYGRQERWGRLVKNAGLGGAFGSETTHQPARPDSAWLGTHCLRLLRDLGAGSMSGQTRSRCPARRSHIAAACRFHWRGSLMACGLAGHRARRGSKGVCPARSSGALLAWHLLASQGGVRWA
jgi:hypothetical protein